MTSLVSKTVSAIKCQQINGAYEILNMSKYPSLPNSEHRPSKMAKLQGIEKYLLTS